MRDTVYFLVFEGFADWQAALALCEIRRPGDWHVQTVGFSSAAVVSMGGLAAMYAHHRHPDVFGGAICMSPSFWFAKGAILRFVEETPRPPISRVYLDCGAREGGGRMLPFVERMAKKLRGRGYPPEQLMMRADQRGAHNERHWRRRLPLALRFMFRI